MSAKKTRPLDTTRYPSVLRRYPELAEYSRSMGAQPDYYLRALDTACGTMGQKEDLSLEDFARSLKEIYYSRVVGHRELTGRSKLAERTLHQYFRACGTVIKRYVRDHIEAERPGDAEQIMRALRVSERREQSVWSEKLARQEMRERAGTQAQQRRSEAGLPTQAMVQAIQRAGETIGDNETTREHFLAEVERLVSDFPPDVSSVTVSREGAVSVQVIRAETWRRAG